MRARDGQACHFTSRPRPFRRSFLAVLPSAARGRAGLAPPPPEPVPGKVNGLLF
jgi:hypothetical protein